MLILQQEVSPHDKLVKMKCGGLAFLEIQFSGFEKVWGKQDILLLKWNKLA